MLRKLSILGPGLLGGSIGLAARQRKVAERVVMWARRPDAAEQAYKLGAADEAATDLAKAVADADLVVLATPIGAMRALTEQMRPALPGRLRRDRCRQCQISDRHRSFRCIARPRPFRWLASHGGFGTVRH